jgi:hypothetical protein
MVIRRRPEWCAWRPARGARGGHAYEQTAFRRLLALERVRSRRAGVPLLLLLVEVRSRRDAGGVLGPASVARLFGALAGCLRETDVVGWYRRARVAGAVLTELGDAPVDDVSQLLTARVARALAEGLPASVAYHVAIRLYRRPRPTVSMPAPVELMSGGC